VKDLKEYQEVKVKQELNEIEINGTVYVKKGTEQAKATKLEGMPYCIVRTYSAGVFAGYLEKREGQEAVVRNARRIWYWNGAASLSQLSVDGTSKPNSCKFPCEVDKVELMQVIEIIECTEIARKSIQGVPLWEK